MRKLIKKIYQLNWLNYFVEFIIVFLGITIAIYFNARAEEKKLFELEKTYLSTIGNDLTVDSLEHLQIIEFFKEGISQLETVRVFIITEDRSKTDSIILSVNKLSKSSKYHPDVQTYHSLVQNGEILKISNFELRSKMAQYYAYYETLRERHELVKEIKNKKLFPFVTEHYNLFKKEVLNEEAYFSHELQNIVFEIRDSEIQRIFAYKKVMEMGNELNGLIEDELRKIANN